jgi:hypothetical protein
MQVQGTLTGWIPDFYETPTYNGEPSDFRLKILVTDGDSCGATADELLEELADEYDRACGWYRDVTGRKSFYDAPFEAYEDGSLLIKMTAKLAYGEFPVPVIDTDLQPIARDLNLREGTEVLVAVKPTFIPRKSPKGGLRLCPKGIQVLKAVTLTGTDKGDFDVSKVFKKQAGFKQSKPNLEELATVGGDADF